MEQELDQLNSDALWEAYQQDRSVETKNRLVMHYVFLVNHIVSRMMPVYGQHMSYDDLVGYGVLGLIDAVDKFVPARNVRFEAYATKRIKGEIIDNMRQQDWASVSLRNRIKQIGRAYDELESDPDNPGYPASEEDVAERLGLDVQQVRTALEKAYMFNMVHFETLVLSGGPNGGSFEDSLPGYEGDMPEEKLQRQEFSNVLANAISALSPNERKVITLYYYEEFMLKDIAKTLQVTPARVSQIHSRALLKIRTAVERYYQLAQESG